MKILEIFKFDVTGLSLSSIVETISAIIEQIVEGF